MMMDSIVILYFIADEDYSTRVLWWVVGEIWLGIVVRGYMDAFYGIDADEFVKTVDDGADDGDDEI